MLQLVRLSETLASIRSFTQIPIGFIAIYSMQRILEILAEDSKQPMQDAYLFAFITFMVHLSFAQADLIQLWHSRRSYERARGQVCIMSVKGLTNFLLDDWDSYFASYTTKHLGDLI